MYVSDEIISDFLRKVNEYNSVDVTLIWKSGNPCMKGYSHHENVPMLF